MITRSERNTMINLTVSINSKTNKDIAEMLRELSANIYDLFGDQWSVKEPIVPAANGDITYADGSNIRWTLRSDEGK